MAWRSWIGFAVLHTDNNRRIALLALAALACIWGYNWVVMKIAVKDAAPFAFAAWRTLGGGCALAAGALITRKSLRPHHLRSYVWIGLFQTAAFVGLVTWAVVSAGAGKVAMLSYTMPLWVSLFASPFLGERLTRAQTFAICIAFAGVACMIGPLHGNWFSSVLALVAGLAWAIGVILTKRIQRQGAIDVYSLTMWQMLAGGAVLLAVALIVPERPTVWSATYVAAIAYNIILATAVAYVLWTFVLNRLSARDASMGTLTNPIVGTIAAWLQLGEVPSLLDAAGMALVVVGLAVLATTDRT